MDKKEKFMLKAIELSKISIREGGGPFGCVIVKNNNIIAEGYNQVTKNNDPTAHAEILAIRKACSILKQKRLDGYTMIVNVAPCLLCLEAIKSARIREVHYLFSNHNPERKTIKLPKLIQHNSEEENLLKIFFREKRLK